MTPHLLGLPQPAELKNFLLGRNWIEVGCMSFPLNLMFRSIVNCGILENPSWV